MKHTNLSLSFLQSPFQEKVSGSSVSSELQDVFKAFVFKENVHRLSSVCTPEKRTCSNAIVQFFLHCYQTLKIGLCHVVTNYCLLKISTIFDNAR